MAERFTTLSELDDALQEITNAYRGAVLNAIADGVKEGAEIFKKTASEVSPVKTGEYKKSWAIKPMRKARYVKYVGNTKKVKAHKADDEPTIPLINILEFSKGKKARPHVGKAIDKSKDQIINLMASKIQKEGK